MGDPKQATRRKSGLGGTDDYKSQTSLGSNLGISRQEAVLYIETMTATSDHRNTLTLLFSSHVADLLADNYSLSTRMHATITEH